MRALRKKMSRVSSAVVAVAAGLAIGLIALGGCATMPRPPLGRLSLDEKIGQMFVFGSHGVFMNERSPAYQSLLHQVRDNRVGGFIWSISNVYETAMLNRQLQKEAGVPLLISADLEAGVGMRLNDTTLWPWPMAIGATGDPSLAEQEGKFVAQEARAIGINQIFAPVADVNNNPDNPVINARSFGEDPQAVGRYVAAFIRGVQSEGVIATAKHFPGHGDTRVDSHRALPVLEVSRERLSSVELVPFRAAIDAGVRSIMIAHLAVPALDPSLVPPLLEKSTNPYSKEPAEISAKGTLPATLSRAMVQGLLRGDLKFDGLVVTDAMDMGGISNHFDAGEAAIRAIEAGDDQVLMSPDIDAAIKAVKAAVLSGRLPEARIDQSVRRILAAKASVTPQVAGPEILFREVDPPEHRALAQQIATRSITLVREQPSILPLSRDARVVEVVVSEFPEVGSPLTDFDRELRTRLRKPVKPFLLDSRSCADESDPIAAAASNSDLVVVALAVRTRSGSGKIGIPEMARNLIERIAATGKPVLAISFGSPYLLREIPSVQTYLAAYGIQPLAQVAAARAVFGEERIAGHLPVSLPGLYPIGSGIVREASSR